jgi:hypothetical protein
VAQTTDSQTAVVAIEPVTARGNHMSTSLIEIDAKHIGALSQHTEYILRRNRKYLSGALSI